MLSDKGDLKGALENYSKALELRLSVATADLKNAFATTSVARAYERIARILGAMGDRSGALNIYKQMLAFHESRGRLSEQADDCAKIGDFYSALSSEPGMSVRDHTTNLQNALSWYRRSRELYFAIPMDPQNSSSKRSRELIKK